MWWITRRGSPLAAAVRPRAAAADRVEPTLAAARRRRAAAADKVEASLAAAVRLRAAAADRDGCLKDIATITDENIEQETRDPLAAAEG